MRLTCSGIWGARSDRGAALVTLRMLYEIGDNFINTADSYGPDRAPHAVTCGCGDDDGQFVQLGSFRKADHVVFELARGNVPDARHEADLMIDEDNRRILGGQRFVPG